MFDEQPTSIHQHERQHENKNQSGPSSTAGGPQKLNNKTRHIAELKTPTKPTSTIIWTSTINYT